MNIHIIVGFLTIAFLVLIYISVTKKENMTDLSISTKSVKIHNLLDIPLSSDVFEIDANQTKSVDIPVDSQGAIRLMHDKHIVGDYMIGGHIPDNIYIGQVITKDNVRTTDYWPIKDMPEIRIHNLTGIPLQFNGHIVVPPRQAITYTGREQSGIAAGFVLQNNENIFKKFQVKRPVTDVYYGVMSDHLMPTYTRRHINLGISNPNIA